MCLDSPCRPLSSQATRSSVVSRGPYYHSTVDLQILVLGVVDRADSTN